jgi:hypothetical protein
MHEITDYKLLLLVQPVVIKTTIAKAFKKLVFAILSLKTPA